jgi:tetratricopeptide (TPR) repeat protein
MDPFIVLLLNLTGFCLGYYALRKWKRGIFHFIICMLIGVSIILTQNIWLLLVLFGWLIWMAFDGWRIARAVKGQLKIPLYFLPVAVLLITFEVSGILFYRHQGKSFAQSGQRAYEQQDCPSTIEYFGKIVKNFKLVFGTEELSTFGANIEECEFLSEAATLANDGNYPAAIDQYEAYLTQYPDSNFHGSVEKSILGNYQAWAESLITQGSYIEAVDTYRKAQDEFVSGNFDGEISSTLLKLGLALRNAQEYELAVNECKEILNGNPDSEVYADAEDCVIGSFIAWGKEFDEAGDYQNAILKYEAVLKNSPNADIYSQASTSIYSSYQAWANQFVEKNDFQSAIDKYELLLKDHPDIENRSSRENIDSLYLLWVDKLKAEENFKQAIDVLNRLIKEYPEFNSNEVNQLLSEQHSSWVGQLIAQKDYANAIDILESMRKLEGSTYTEADINNRSAEVIYSWGKELAANEFEEAISKYKLLIQEYPESEYAAKALLDLAGLYLKAGEKYLENNQYAQAIQSFEEVIAGYPDSEEAKLVLDPLAKAYLQQGIILTNEGQLEIAGESLEKALESTENPTIIASIQSAQDALIGKIAADSGALGSKILRDALESVCDVKPPESPAIGYNQSGIAKALYCSDRPGGFHLPENRIAQTPGELHFVITFQYDEYTFDKCKYESGHYLTVKGRRTTVTVRYASSARVYARQTFNGEVFGCPQWWRFSSSDDTRYGDWPDVEDINLWVASVLP